MPVSPLLSPWKGQRKTCGHHSSEVSPVLSGTRPYVHQPPGTPNSVEPSKKGTSVCLRTSCTALCVSWSLPETSTSYLWWTNKLVKWNATVQSYILKVSGHWITFLHSRGPFLCHLMCLLPLARNSSNIVGNSIYQGRKREKEKEKEKERKKN